MNRHIQGMLLTKIRAAERAIAPLLTRGLTEISGAADKQGLVQELGQFAETAEKTLRHEEQGKYREIADTLLQAARALPVPADAAQTAPACALIADVLQETERMLSTEKLKKIFVFLPYKASMWDSLESIYLAAAEDKAHCEPYVVPIPYADLNPDRAAKEWHCEVKEYPGNIPVEDWKDFTIDTLRLMRPDAIFIHNPYDDLNRVTSIHPQYYSRELKQCTDKLVYVPYFVVGDTIEPHFCQTPGVLNADYVIVQDENIQKQYEAYYPGGNPPQGKILPLGSPKFDKVLSVKKEDFELPVKWEHIVHGKKVILYLTSISAALANTDKVCAKLRSVLAYFKAHQSKVALWWRPHPLMEATFQSMRPDFYAEYKAIVEQYKKEAWGIYDDTAELDRAIAYSDAYYGDMSSVAHLYRVTGKPILLENIADRNYVPYWIFSLIFDERRKEFLIKSLEMDSLYAIDAETGEFLREIPLPKVGQEGLGNSSWHHGLLKRIGDEIIISPLYSSKWYSYNLVKERIALIYQGREEENFLIKGAVEYGGKLYFYNEMSQLWVYDPDLCSLEKVGEWPQFSAYVKDQIVFDAACVCEGVMYLPLPHEGKVLTVCLDTYDEKILSIGCPDDVLVNAAADGNSIWFLSNNAVLLKYDRKTGSTARYAIYPHKSKKTVPYFYDLAIGKDTVLLFPCNAYSGAAEVVAFSKRKKTSMEIALHSDGYYGLARLNRMALAIDNVNGNIDFYDVDENRFLRRMVLSLDAKTIRSWYQTLFGREKAILNEKSVGGENPLEAFADFIQRITAGSSNRKEHYGRKIYQWSEQHED